MCYPPPHVCADILVQPYSDIITSSKGYMGYYSVE